MRDIVPLQDAQAGSLSFSFLCPHLNQEDLLKPKAFLLLLNSRGRHPPWDFAAADLAAITIIKEVWPKQIALRDFVMVVNGCSTEYGTIMMRGSALSPTSATVQKHQPSAQDGCVILAIQERVLAFLLQCSLDLLHDIPSTDLISDSFPVQPEPQLQSDKAIAGFDSLLTMVEEALYRLPAKLDFGRIESLLAARSSAAEDHIWWLREDPGYFAEQLLDAKEHQTAVIADAFGTPHPCPENNGDKLWTRAILILLWKSHLELEVFAELYQHSRELRTLQAKYRTAISPFRDLPNEYLGALLRFKWSLSRAADLLKFNATDESLQLAPDAQPDPYHDSPRVKIV